MKLLLDTQVALWWLTASRRLPRSSRDLIAGSHCVVSAASVWEVAIKHGLKKLPVSGRRFRDEMRSAGALIIAVSDEHLLAMEDLTLAHPDPFDRLLIGVAQAERLILLTADRALITLAEENSRLSIRGI